MVIDTDLRISHRLRVAAGFSTDHRGAASTSWQRVRGVCRLVLILLCASGVVWATPQASQQPRRDAETKALPKGPVVMAKGVPSVKDWTILVYAAGDEMSVSESTRTMLSLIEEAALAVPNSQVNIVVQHDDLTDDPNYRYLLTSTPGRPAVTQASAAPARDTSHDKSPPFHLRTPPIPESEVQRTDPSFRYQEKDSGDPRTLKAFLNWGITAYPAQHYVLIVAGHSWGLQGHMQDFYYNGAYWKRSTLIKNYELRRVLEEVYREQRSRIPEGIFDALIIDACVSGQLEIALELKDVATYFASSSIETPYYGLPYSRVLAPFLRAVNAHPGASPAQAHSLLERQLLASWTQMYVTDHSLGGQMAAKEQEYEPIATFALRNAGLTQVAKSLTDFVLALNATSIPDEFRKGQLEDLDSLADADGAADLLELSRAFVALLSKRYAQSQDPKWQLAVERAAELVKSLDPPTQDPASTPVRVHHPTARGAWVHLQLDTLRASSEMTACEALRMLAMFNHSLKQDLPTYLNPSQAKQLANEELCDSRPPSFAAPPTRGVPVPLWQVFDLKAQWPHGIPAYLTEYGPPLPATPAGVHSVGTLAPLPPKVEKRVLSIWIDRGSAPSLDRNVVLTLPGSTGGTVEYYAAPPSLQPPPALARETGIPAGPVGVPLRREILRMIPYSLRTNFTDFTTPSDPQRPLPGLYVAEAHSAGTLFKHGLGILLKRSLGYDHQKYFQGRTPVDRVENAAHALTIEAYLGQLSQQGTLTQYPHASADFYRLHRIGQVGWGDFLFGHGAGPPPVVIPPAMLERDTEVTPYETP